MAKIDLYDGGKLFEISTGLNNEELAKLLSGEQLTFNYTDESGVIEVKVRIIRKT